MNWYVAFTDSNSDNEYDLFASDEDAIAGFTQWEREPNNPRVLEIWKCKNDETLSPIKLIWH